MKPEEIRGAIGMATLVVRPADTTVAQALNDLPILSTTTLLTLVEGSCSAALAEHFAPGETSVTSNISLTTMGTVGVGAEIRAHATCVEIEGQIFRFLVEVHHDSKLIATARIARTGVDRVSYMARLAAESMMHRAS